MVQQLQASVFYLLLARWASISKTVEYLFLCIGHVTLIGKNLVKLK